jgi:hypothetical protein
MSGAKRHRSDEHREFSVEEKECGAVWLENVPTNVSVVSLVSKLVSVSGNKLSPRQVKTRPRAARGGILVEFDPKPLSAVVYQIADRLGFPELVVHPPASVKQDPASSVVMFKVPVHHLDEDLMTYMIPAPLAVERFQKQVNGSSAVKVTFKDPNEASQAVANGIKFGSRYYKCSPFVVAPSVFCHRCKQVGDQHVDCVVVCANCTGDHPTSLCKSNVKKCLRCGEPHVLFKCPEILKKRAEAIKRKQEAISGRNGRSYKDAVNRGLEGRIDPQFAQFVVTVVLETALKAFRSIMIENDFLQEEDYNELEMGALLKEEMSKSLSSQLSVKSLISQFKNIQPVEDVKMDIDPAEQSSQPIVMPKVISQKNSSRLPKHKNPGSGGHTSVISSDHKQCPFCEKMFHYKGLGPHVKSCAEKHEAETIE